MELEKTTSTAVALGAFDGLHRGHMAVIAQTLSLAKKLDCSPQVCTFLQDPSMLLQGRTDYLVSQGEKEALLLKQGIRKINKLDFAKVRDLSPQAFVADILVQKMQAKAVICGTDFRFGKKASGNATLLKSLCKEQGVQVSLVEPLLEGGVPISATRIRQALVQGDVALAEKLLGRPFGVSFTVIEGNRIGRTLGTPTINQKLPKGFVQPRFGVYASLVYVDGQQLCGVTNVGVKPTVGQYDPLLETWIPNFNKDMYGMEIQVELIAFIRPEKKFAGLEALRAEIYQNAKTAKELCASRMKIDAAL